VGAVLRQRVELDEGAGVEQEVDALARGQLAALVLARGPPRVLGGGARQQLAELLDLVLGVLPHHFPPLHAHPLANAECGVRSAESRGSSTAPLPGPLVPIPHSALRTPHYIRGFHQGRLAGLSAAGGAAGADSGSP